MSERKEPTLTDDHDLDIHDIDDEFLLSDDEDNQEDNHLLDSQNHTSATAEGRNILLHDGKKYAVGLTWLTNNSDSDELDNMSKKAQQIDADFYCGRSFVEQTGFGYLKSGHRIGMPSAAAMAADILIGEWHGVFQAENGWLYVGVHADNIAPDGDRFFEQEEDAYNYFIEKSESYNWPKTYAPESWNISHNDSEISIDRILEEIPTSSLRPANLDALFSGKANKNLVLIGITIFIAFIILSFFSKAVFTEIIPQPAVVNTPALEVSDIISAPPRRVAPDPEQDQQPINNFQLPQPEKAIDLCMLSFSDLTVSFPGWTMDIMRCRGNFAESVWNRDSGSLDDIKNYQSQLSADVSKNFPTNTAFIASKVIGNLSEYNQKVDLITRDNAIDILNDSFTTIGTLAINDNIPKRDVNQSNSIRQQINDLARVEKSNWIGVLPSLEVRYRTKADPFAIKQYFNIPGLKLNMIEWDIGSGQWVYDFQIYLRPIASATAQ